MDLHVLGANVALGRQEHLNVLGGGIEARGEVVGGHLCGDCRGKDGGGREGKKEWWWWGSDVPLRETLVRK